MSIAEKELALSFVQERLWFLDQLEIGSPVYSLTTTYYLHGLLNLTALKASFQQLITRHDVLRTLFKPEGGQPRLEFAPIISMDMPLEIDINSDPEQFDKPTYFIAASEAANAAFDLEFGPLFYAKLMSLSADEHLLIISAHRSVFDARSLSILMAELAGYYNQAVRGENLDASKLTLQYAEFAAWQREQLSSAKLKTQLNFWLEQLKDAPLVLELPTDKARPAAQSLKAGQVHFVLEAAQLQSLEEISQAHNAKFESLLLAAFNALIFRYTGRDDVLVGRAADNRSKNEFQSMIGAFENTLILRTALDGEMLFSELLEAQHEGLHHALEQSELPFEILMNNLRPERDMSRSPLVQVFFEYQAQRPSLPSFDQLSLEQLLVDTPFTQYDLELHLWHDNEENALRGKFIYASDLFDPSTINRMAGHYQNLLEGIAQDPDQPLYALPLLTEAEQHQLLIEWNDTDLDYADMSPVYRLFEIQVEQSPQRVAARYDGETLTYAELNKRANRLAHFLVEQGVKADTIVALLADRNLDYLTALLAINKAGGAFLPLDPRHPSGRIAQILMQSESPLILTDVHYEKVAHEASEETLIAPQVFQIAELLSGDYPEENLALTPAPHDLAYVMFTSGSTGLPKGVMVEHLGMVNHNYAKIADVGMTSSDILAQNGPQSFDIMVWQFLAPLIVGAQVCIFKDEIAYNPPVLYEHIQQEAITILQIVPSLLTPIIQDADARGQALDLPHLRWIVPTGEALPTELCRDWLRLYPDIPLLNTYGSTECSDDQCHYPVREVPADYRPPIMTIGTPIPNMRLYVLDKWLQPVPIGVIGELYVGGIGVGRGYLKDAKKTANAFIPDPFHDGMRLYKTNDQGRFMADGTVEFLGRIDHMVKVRGYRIELGEIESVLSQHPSVRQAVVLVHEDARGQKHLVGYVVCDAKDDQTAPTTLRNYVSEKLPEYMIPSAIMILDAMPLTPNQKVDRKALPTPDFAKQRAEGYVAPTTETEAKLCEIWAEVLGLERVGTQDNFFELGGYSLLAIRIFAQIERHFSKRLPLGTLFQAPTIADLSEIIDDKSDNSPVWSPLVPIQTKGTRPPFFCVGGGILHMQNIANHLGLKQPFYALQTEAISDDKLMKAQIELIAEELLDEVRKVQPRGPYYLAGAYASGLVALEMAHQLQATGEQIAALIAFNTMPARHSAGMSVYTPLYKRVARRGRKLIKANPIKAAQEEIDWVHVKEYGMNVFWKIAYKTYSKIGKPLPRNLRQGEYAESLLRVAVAEYHPAQPYHGKITLFSTVEWAARYEDVEKWGWEEYVTEDSPVEMHYMPGDPCTMFTEPNAYVVAQQLRQSLRKARSKYQTVTSELVMPASMMERPEGEAK